MKKLIQRDYTVASGATVGNTLDLKIKNKSGILPRVGAVYVLNDTSLIIGKVKMTFSDNETDESFLDKIDIHALSSAFDEKVKLNTPTSVFNYEFVNGHTEEVTVSLMIELEY